MPGRSPLDNHPINPENMPHLREGIMTIYLGLLIAIPAALIGPLWMFLLISGTPEQQMERREVKEAGDRYRQWQRDNP
jgi:hypothetical protein